jgi:hypothetical protein
MPHRPDSTRPSPPTASDQTSADGLANITPGESRPTIFERVKGIASFLRDVGLILGVPAIVSLGLSIYELQNKAHETEIKALEAQNTVLKETQFDRAVALIKAQKEAYELDKESTTAQIDHLRDQLTESNNKFQADLRKVANDVGECTARIISLINTKIMNETIHGNNSAESSLSDKNKEELFLKTVADTVSSICSTQR